MLSLISALPPSYLLQEATAIDLDEICELERVSQPSPWMRAIFESELLLDYSYLWIIRSQEDRVIGYLSFWLIADEVHILNVVIHPVFRGQGLGKALIESLFRSTTQLPVVAYTLEVRESNTVARKLYENMGFLNVGRRPNYYSNNGEAAIIMTKIGEESFDEPLGG